MSEATEIPQATVDELKAKHGELHLIGNEYGAAAFRVPSAAEWQRMRDEQANPGARGVAVRHLVHACRVWPDVTVFKAMVDVRPALIDVFGGELVEIAGAKAATIVKKL